MNRVYKVVWNSSVNCWTVASELCSSVRKKSSQGILCCVLLSVSSLSIGDEINCTEDYCTADGNIIISEN
ncbi:ESPR domain-containing protein, partial [Escherichia coli]|nr:ESPR domain-containing protein [Escherichia coli]